MDKDELNKKDIKIRNLCLAIHLSLKFLMDNERKKKSLN